MKQKEINCGRTSISLVEATHAQSNDSDLQVCSISIQKECVFHLEENMERNDMFFFDFHTKKA